LERVPVSVSDEEAQEGLRSPTFQSRREPAELILCRDVKTNSREEEFVSESLMEKSGFLAIILHYKTQVCCRNYSETLSQPLLEHQANCSTYLSYSHSNPGR